MSGVVPSGDRLVVRAKAMVQRQARVGSIWFMISEFEVSLKLDPPMGMMSRRLASSFALD